MKFMITLFRGIVPKTKVLVWSSTQFHVPRNWHELWLKFSLLLNDSCTLLDAIEVHIQMGWHFLLKYRRWRLSKLWVEISYLLGCYVIYTVKSCWCFKRLYCLYLQGQGLLFWTVRPQRQMQYNPLKCWKLLTVPLTLSLSVAKYQYYLLKRANPCRSPLLSTGIWDEHSVMCSQTSGGQCMLEIYSVEKRVLICHNFKMYKSWK
jgi:hypothetical protein